MNRCAQEIDKFIKSVGEKSRALTRHTSRKHTTRARPANKWFDADCKRQKTITNDALKKWKKDYHNQYARSAFFH